MELIKGVNLGLAFALELAMLAGLGVWAYGLAPSPVLQWGLALVAIGAGVAAWARWAAPKSARRLAQPWLLLFKLGLFGLTGLLLAQAGHSSWGLLLALVAALNLGLAQLWEQDGVA